MGTMDTLGTIVNLNPQAFEAGESVGKYFANSGLLNERHNMLSRVGELVADPRYLGEHRANYLPNPAFSLGVIAGATSVLVEGVENV